MAPLANWPETPPMGPQFARAERAFDAKRQRHHGVIMLMEGTLQLVCFSGAHSLAS